MPDRSLISLLRSRESVHFDLDGVLLDSNELKVRCMVDAIAGLGPQVVAPFIAEFRMSFGRSRREHFRRLYAHHLRGDERSWEDFYALYGGAYGALVRARYGSASLCLHAASLVRSLGAAGVPMTVVTGTPTAEAVAVLRTHGLDSAFAAVLGGEQPKPVRLREALSLTGASREGSVLLGDSLADLQAANQTRMPAVFVERYSLDPEVARIAVARGEQVSTVRDLDPAGAVPHAGSPVAELAARRADPAGVLGHAAAPVADLVARRASRSGVRRREAVGAAA